MKLGACRWKQGQILYDTGRMICVDSIDAQAAVPHMLPRQGGLADGICPRLAGYAITQHNLAL